MAAVSHSPASRLLRIVIPVAILLGLGYFVSQYLVKTGTDMAEKSIKDGIASQVKYHQGIIKDAPECAAIKAKLEPIKAIRNTDEAGKQLMVI